MPSIREFLTSRITRMYPFQSGCGTFSNSKIVGFLSGASSGKTWAKLSGGGEVQVELNDYVGRAAYFVGDLDRKITWLCKKIVREGDTVLDIGANIGIVTVNLAEFVGKTGKVYAFEPNPQLCKVLAKTIDRNKLTNTKLYPVALGSIKTVLKLVIPDGNAGAASLIRNTNLSNSTIELVDVVPLDEIVKQESISSIRLIKIDVEGFEVNVFEGFRHTLSYMKPEAIIFEMNDDTELNFFNRPLIKFLQSFNYDIFEIQQSFLKNKLVKLNSLARNASLSHDFLACPQGAVSDNIARLIGATVY